MEVSGQLLASIGMIYWGVIFLSILAGYLRNDNVLIIHIVVSVILGCIGIQFYSQNLASMAHENGAGFLFGPIVFIGSYALLRMLYKRVFKFEPDMVAYTGYSHRDRRKLNFMDYLTFFIPAILSTIINLVMAN